MKVKLRDLTEKQYEKWKRDNCTSKNECIACPLIWSSCSSWIYHKDLYSDKFLNQKIEIDDEPILTDEEKEYLEVVLKPFRKGINYIEKRKYFRLNDHGETDYEFLVAIFYKNKWDFTDQMEFPLFPIDTIYKGMEIDKEYTLKELGLFKEDAK